MELVRSGAADYMAKPWDEEKMLTAVQNLLELRETQTRSQQILSQRRKAQSELSEQYDLAGLIYASEAMEQVVRLATQVAHSDVAGLDYGPEWFRQRSDRKDHSPQFQPSGQSDGYGECGCLA